MYGYLVYWLVRGRFETSIEGKLDKTDLLEVYSDIEKKKVMEKEVHLKDKWKTVLHAMRAVQQKR